MKGILAFDIDGTLTHKLDWISPEVVFRLKSLGEEGWQIALVTGRTFSFAWQILESFDFPYLLAVQNGADIIEMPKKKLLLRSYFDSSIVSLIEEAYEGREEDFIIYAGIDRGDFCFYRPERFSPQMIAYLEKLQALGSVPWQASTFAFDVKERFPLIKCFGKEKPMRRIYNKLCSIPGLEISTISDPIDRSLFLNLITHSSANKGAVIEYLRDHFQTPFVIAAGDDRNDEKLLQFADIAIAMETAPEKLREMADIIAPHPKDLGILCALDQALNSSYHSPSPKRPRTIQ